MAQKFKSQLRRNNTRVEIEWLRLKLGSFARKDVDKNDSLVSICVPKVLLTGHLKKAGIALKNLYKNYLF